ncbi:MAG: aspartyl protease family protein [Saprospiraceae bacterium]
MGFNLPKDQDKVEIPFEFKNNFIIVNLIFDDVFPLRFIFDTGSENTILVKKEFTDILNISYKREFKVVGADFEQELVAYLVRNVNMDLSNLPGQNLDLLVLKDDYFKFEEHTGLKIHGILGMDLFKVFTIQIDYRKQKLTLHRIENFTPPKKFKPLTTQIHRNKPYLVANAKIKNDTITKVKLLLDTGASLSLLLHNNTAEALTIPEKLIPGQIGNGLGGFIQGFIGRINHLSFDEYYFNSVITNFQEINQEVRNRVNFGRNGILGNEILSRFNVIFDIARSKVYLKPIKRYNKYFKYDRSGITLISSGKKLNQFRIKELIPNSPATEAGLQIGDIVFSVNSIPLGRGDLKRITRKFQGRVGKRIQVIALRGGERVKFKFRLRDLI